MSRQVHCIVKDADNRDSHLSFDMEEDKMAGAMPVSGGMQRIHSSGDVGTRSCPWGRGAFSKTCDGASQDVFIEAGVFFTELVGGPD